MNSACLEEANQTLAAITHSQIQIITDIEFIILPLLQQNRRYSSDSNQCKTIPNFLSPKSRFDYSMYSRDPFLNMFGLAGCKKSCCVFDSSEEAKAKFPHSPIHHYTSIYGALFFSVSPVRCTCIIKYGAVRKFFRGRDLQSVTVSC